MQIMILEEDPVIRTQIAAALAPQGFDILSFGRIAPAKEAARRAIIDVLVLGEAVEGRLAHDVALLAEWRNPGLGAILLSDRSGEDLDELFELIPSLQAVLGRKTDPRTLVQLALSAAHSQKGDEERREACDDEMHEASASAARRASEPRQAGPAEVVAAVPTAGARDAGQATGPSRVVAPEPSRPAKTADPVPRFSLPVLDSPVVPPALASEPADTVLSAAETRKLLSELARRYAKMTEQPPRLQAASVTPARPSSQAAAPVPAAKPVPVAEPAPLPCPREAPARVAVGGRRLHLA